MLKGKVVSLTDKKENIRSFFSEKDFSEKENALLISKTLEFLKSYGIRAECFFLRKGSRARNCILTLAVWYLNTMLERKLGVGNIVIGNVIDISKKFQGIKFFEKEGSGVLKWALKMVNNGTYANFQKAWEAVRCEDFKSGKVSILRNTSEGEFCFDPSEVVMKRSGFLIGECWKLSDGKSFFCAQDLAQRQVFIPDKGQEMDQLVRSAGQLFSEMDEDEDEKEKH